MAEEKQKKVIHVMENEHYIGLKDELDRIAEQKKVSTASIVLATLKNYVDEQTR